MPLTILTLIFLISQKYKVHDRPPVHGKYTTGSNAQGDSAGPLSVHNEKTNSQGNEGAVNDSMDLAALEIVSSKILEQELAIAEADLISAHLYWNATKTTPK